MRHHTEEISKNRIQLAKKYFCRSLAFFVIKELQIKTNMRFHHNKKGEGTGSRERENLNQDM